MAANLKPRNKMGLRVAVLDIDHLLDILRRNEKGCSFLISPGSRTNHGQKITMWRFAKKIPKAFDHPGGGRLGIRVMDMLTESELSFENDVMPHMKNVRLYYLPNGD